MRHVPWLPKIALIAVTLALLFTSRATGAEWAMLDLGAEVVVLAPEVTIPLPLTLSVTTEGPVHVTVEIAYPGSELKFIDVQPGSTAERAKAKVTAESKSASGAEQRVVITIEAKEPLTSGSLATINFGVTSEAKVGTEIAVKNVARTARNAKGEDFQTRGAEGLITLTAPPAPCFFYMH